MQDPSPSLSEQRLRLLDDVGRATRALLDPVEIMATTARLLGTHLAATRCAYADVEADGDHFTIRSDWSRPGVPSSAGHYSLTLFGPKAVANLHRGVHLVVADVERELGDDGGAPMFRAIGIQAIVCAGLVKQGRLVAMMAVHQAEPRAWTAGEIQLIEEVVDRCWAHIERVRDHALLLEQDRNKDQFLAMLAHELRNPLAPLRYAAVLLRAQDVNGSHGKARAVIDRQVATMARLVDDLLDLSRINRGLIALQRQRLELATAIDEAVEAALPAIQAAHHQLDVQRPAQGLAVWADHVRIVQVLGNLLNNAAKYTPDGGHIRVRAWAQDGEVVVEVCDNGIGIAAHDQPKLFRLFSQLRQSVSRSHGGLGIGLALSRNLVELHGGRIEVHSAGPGQGSCFRIALPRGDAPPALPD